MNCHYHPNRPAIADVYTTDAGRIAVCVGCASREIASDTFAVRMGVA